MISARTDNDTQVDRPAGEAQQASPCETEAMGSNVDSGGQTEEFEVSLSLRARLTRQRTSSAPAPPEPVEEPLPMLDGVIEEWASSSPQCSPAFAGNVESEPAATRHPVAEWVAEWVDDGGEAGFDRRIDGSDWQEYMHNATALEYAPSDEPDSADCRWEVGGLLPWPLH
jgi:hypothetical protein